MDASARAKKIAATLKETYPDAACALRHKNALELLVATILSAQCTDERVNKVTPPLFKKYQGVRDYAQADLKTLGAEIRSTGFYKQKAKALKTLGAALEKKFHGQVPRTMEELVTLPGVWRKTANVILGNVFGIPGIVVDTHVRRLSNRMGLSNQSDPDKIEADLMKLLPSGSWTSFSHAMIFHGRHICTARKPACGSCPIQSFCPKIGLPF